MRDWRRSHRRRLRAGCASAWDPNRPYRSGRLCRGHLQRGHQDHSRRRALPRRSHQGRGSSGISRTGAGIARTRSNAGKRTAPHARPRVPRAQLPLDRRRVPRYRPEDLRLARGTRTHLSQQISFAGRNPEAHAGAESEGTGRRCGVYRWPIR